MSMKAYRGQTEEAQDNHGESAGPLLAIIDRAGIASWRQDERNTDLGFHEKQLNPKRMEPFVVNAIQAEDWTRQTGTVPVVVEN
jgi:hypothetical protein